MIWITNTEKTNDTYIYAIKIKKFIIALGSKINIDQTDIDVLLICIIWFTLYCQMK